MVNSQRSKINRKNGKLARGKKTEEGLQRSARNATVHGVYSSKPPLAESDDRELYEGIKAGLTEEFQPEKFTEKVAVEQVAMALLRLGRLYRAQSELINRQRHERETDRLEKELDNVKPKFISSLDSVFDLGRYEEITPQQQKLIDELEAQLEARSRVQFDDDVVIVNDAKQLRFQREERHLQNILDKNLAKLEESQKRCQNSYVTQLEAEIQPN